MAVTKSFANVLLANIFSNAYVGLSTTLPTIEGGNITEPPTSAGYRRVSAESGSFHASNSTITNGTYLYYPEATESWGKIKYIVVFDTASPETGSCRYYGALDTEKEIVANTVPVFRPNTISISLESE